MRIQTPRCGYATDALMGKYVFSVVGMEPRRVAPLRCSLGLIFLFFFFFVIFL